MDIIDFKKLEKTDKKLFDKFFSAQYYENAEYNFTNLFMWREMLDLRWAVEDDVLFVMSSNESRIAAWQPFGAVEKMQDAITKILSWSKKNCCEKSARKI